MKAQQGRLKGRPGRADVEESGQRAPGLPWRPKRAGGSFRPGRDGRQPGGRCWRDEVGSAKPVGWCLPPPVVCRPGGCRPGGVRVRVWACGGGGPRGPGRRVGRGPRGLPASPRPDAVGARGAAALGCLRHPPLAAPRPRRLHRHDAGHGPLGGRPAAVRDQRDRRRHRRLRSRPATPGGHLGRRGAGHAGLRQLAWAVALRDRRATAPGGRPGTRPLGDHRSPARRALGAHRRAGLERAPDVRSAVGHHHSPLVWCQSGALHHALRRPQQPAAGRRALAREHARPRPGVQRTRAAGGPYPPRGGQRDRPQQDVESRRGVHGDPVRASTCACPTASTSA